MLIGAIVSAGLLSVAGIYDDEQAPLAYALVYAVVISAPLAVRRRWPAAVAVVVCVAYFAGGSLHVPEIYAGSIAMFIALYTVGAWSADRRRAAVVRIALSIGMIVWLLVVIFLESTSTSTEGLSRAGTFSPFAAFMLLQILINLLYFAGAYVLGDRAWAAARQREELAEGRAALERERERTAAQAVALERVRIARELHDVVAHHVSAMGVQAGVARTVLDRDPDAARDTLAGVEASARTAIDELHHLLETLRSPGEETDAPSTVRLDALGELVDHARENGLPTRLTVVGEPRPLPALTQVNLYRIAQESLTNARRHGGPHAAADVRLRYGDDDVELEVSNTGRPPVFGRTGLGLVGMRERAAASGGALEAGPRPDGFVVRVRIPLRAAVPT
ncbi:MAG: sensor histidine kinase [Microbacterium sp.]